MNLVSETSAVDLPNTTSQDDFTSFSQTPLWSGGPTISAVGAKSAEGEVIEFNREVCGHFIAQSLIFGENTQYVHLMWDFGKYSLKMHPCR